MPRRRSKRIGFLTIRALEWEVWLVPPEHSFLHGDMGATDFEACKIYLNRELRYDQLRLTLSHELLHVMFGEEHMDLQKKEEPLVSRLEVSMMELLNQNPMEFIDKLQHK